MATESRGYDEIQKSTVRNGTKSTDSVFDGGIRTVQHVASAALRAVNHSPTNKLAPASILALHSAVGNQAVLRMLGKRNVRRAASLESGIQNMSEAVTADSAPTRVMRVAASPVGGLRPQRVPTAGQGEDESEQEPQEPGSVPSTAAVQSSTAVSVPPPEGGQAPTLIGPPPAKGAGPAQLPPGSAPIPADTGSFQMTIPESEPSGQSEADNRAQMRTDDAVTPTPGGARSIVSEVEVTGGLEQAKLAQSPGPEEQEQGVAIRRWSTDASAPEGRIDLWPTNLVVKMKAPPNLVVSRYDGGWTPEVYFDHEFSWDTHSGPSGHFYLNGQEHGSWDAEDEWTPLRAVPKSSLQQPGPDTYEPTRNTARATFVTRPDFHTDDRTVSTEAPFNTYSSALAAAPASAITNDAFDKTNVIMVAEQGGAVAGRAAQTINANITQSVAKTVSVTATGTFAHTTTSSTETSAGVEGSRGGERPAGGGKDTWGLKANLGRKWTDTEQEQSQRALAELYSEVETSSQSYTVPFNIPAGVPTVALIVPVTRKATATFQILNAEENGRVVGGTSPVSRVTEAHIPKGYAGVYGYDTDYVQALEKHYENCRALRQQCESLRGPALEAKKAELRRTITEFSTQHQPSLQRARDDAFRRLEAMQPASGGQVAAPGVSADNIIRWHTAIEEFFRFANSTTGAPPATR